MKAVSVVFAVIFLSTPSVRRATYPKYSKYQLHIISIHALREEGDFFRLALFA